MPVPRRLFSAPILSAWVATVAFTSCFGLAIASQQPEHPPDSVGTGATSQALYMEHVEPIFKANCYRCHGGLNRRGGLQMDSSAALWRGGKHGPAIVAGHPEQSLLVQLIRHEGPSRDPMPMPPKSKLSDADIALVEAWVRTGAVMDPAQRAGH